MNEKIGINWEEFKKRLIGLYKAPIVRKAESWWKGPKIQDGFRFDKELEAEYIKSIESLVSEYEGNAANEIERVMFKLRIRELFSFPGGIRLTLYFRNQSNYAELPKRLQEVEAEVDEHSAIELIKKLDKKKEEEKKRKTNRSG